MNRREAFDEIVRERRSVRAYDKEAPFDSEAVTRSLQRAVLAPNSSNLQLWQFYHVRDPAKKRELAGYCLGQPAATTARELVVVVTRKDLWKERVEWNLRVLKGSFLRRGGGGADNEVAGNNSGKKGNVLQRIGRNEKARQDGVLEYYGKLIPLIYRGDRFGIFGLIKKLYVNLIMSRGKPAYREVGYHDQRIVVHKSAALAAQTFMLSMKAEGYDTCPMEGLDSKRVRKFLDLPKGAEINMVIACGPGKAKGVFGSRTRVPEEEVLFEL